MAPTRPLYAVLAALFFVCATATTERERNFPDLYKFPLHGRGDPLLSFHHPFEPDEDGDPVSGWVQLGSTMVTSNPHGREIIRLTTTAQANQGLFYAYTKTRTNDFNGWFDIQIDTSPDSHEPADGMGLFFTQQRPVIGSAMGMSHTIPGLGLIIDTFSNSRTRMTPYLYAYVSDGHRNWNPDTDGADTELTKGCHLELNKPIRIFVKFVDGKLDVGISFTPHAPEHWHSCFTVDHVNLPFNDGGYLSFSGETGHFFAAHDILSASFVAEHAHNKRPEEYTREAEERRKREEQHASSAHDHYHHYDTAHETHYEREHREREERERREREDRERRERELHERHSAAGASMSSKETMAENLDRQVSDVFASISDHMRGFNSKDAEDTKQRLDGVREMTAHILKEVGRQRTEVKHVVDTMASLKEASNSMAYATNKFKSSLNNMHKSVESLRERTNDMADTHMELQEKMDHHHEIVTSGGGGGHGFLILFFTLQIIILAAVVVSNKMVAANKKMGRMV